MATGPGHEALVATAPTPELLTNVEWTGEMDTAILMAASRRGANASTWATLVIPRGPCAGWTNAQVAERFAFLCERAKTQPCSQEKEQTKAEKNTVWLDALVSPTRPAAGGPDEGFVTPIVPHKAHTPSPTPPRATPPAPTPQQKERRGSRTPPLGYKRCVYFWLFLVIFGYFWLFLVIFGYFWLFLVISVYFRMGNVTDVVFYLYLQG
jgi:hypothetical protein